MRGRRRPLDISTPPLTAPAPSIRSAAYELEVRPLRPADRERVADLFDRLSEQSRHDRFLGPKSRLSEAELDRLTELDYITRDAVAALDRATGDIVGVARYAASRDDDSAADIAVVIADEWQGRGLGGALTRLVVWRGGANGLSRPPGPLPHRQ